MAPQTGGGPKNGSPPQYEKWNCNSKKYNKMQAKQMVAFLKGLVPNSFFVIWASYFMFRWKSFNHFDSLTPNHAERLVQKDCLSIICDFLLVWVESIRFKQRQLGLKGQDPHTNHVFEPLNWIPYILVEKLFGCSEKASGDHFWSQLWVDHPPIDPPLDHYPSFVQVIREKEKRWRSCQNVTDI